MMIPFMAKLVLCQKNSLLTLLEFTDKANKFFNAEDTLQVLINPQGLDGKEVKRKTHKYDVERSKHERIN